MFGLRLKLWMEAHLGRPRQKSSQKSSRVLKDTSSEQGGMGGSSCSNNMATTTSTIGASSPPNGNSHPVSKCYDNALVESDSNLNSSPSSDFSATSPSSPQIQSGSGVVGGSQTAQLPKEDQQKPRKDYQEEKLEESHHQRPTCPRSGSVSNSSTSHNILLGSFCNNLSSPDTGYSTDGYSPKSVYPALSFESSGKSTPKSSYTISSLVSSELQLSSSKHTSASCSVHNGLESDHECAPPRRLKTSASLPPNSEIDRSNSNLGLGNGTRNSQDASSTEKHTNQPYSHSIKQESNSSGWDGSGGNDTVTSIQCDSVSEFSHQRRPTMVAVQPSLGNFPSQSRPDKESETCGESGDDFPKSLNPFCNNNQIQTNPFHPDNNLNIQSGRTENLDEVAGAGEPESGSSGNPSSLLTSKDANRNIRTSFVLVTTSTAHIPESNCLFGIKNSFSIASPRKERTRIKTNPWITPNQYTTTAIDANADANAKPCSVIRANAKGVDLNSALPSEEKGKATTHLKENKNIGIMNRVFGGAGNSLDLSRNKTMSLNCGENESSAISGGGVGVGEEGGEHLQDPHFLYRIPTSVSVSDSGKGSMDPSTNRNSTESYVLSDSASTRNSIISHESELCSGESRCSIGSIDTFSQGKGSFLPSSKDHLRGEEKGGKLTGIDQYCATASSDQQQVKVTKGNEHPEPISEHEVTSTSMTLPLEQISMRSSVSAQTNIVMVDKETDILSDWANTDEDGEDEIETDRHEDDDERVTPTPSSPDTGRAIFQNSRSNSSVTDIDFGDSSAATASSAPPSSIFRHHYAQSVNNKSEVDPYNHHNIMNHHPPNTCYQPIEITEKVVDNFHQGGNTNNKEDMFWNQFEPLVHPQNPHLVPQNDALNMSRIGVMRPTSHAIGIPNANISLSSLCSNCPVERSDYNANRPHNSSNPIARGALGLFRKIFKKGSCSNHKTSLKVKESRSSKSKDGDLDDIPSITGVRSSLLTADALLSPHPLVARKQSLNGYFLTPTPNAFRRRGNGGNGTDSSDSKGSKHHHKSVIKTDIIRLPLGASLSPTQGHNSTFLKNSTNSTTSSKNASLSAPACTSANGTNKTYSNTNTNSTASSIHSMSTSISATSATGETLNENQSRLNDKFYSHSNSNRQSQFMSNGGGSYSPFSKPPPSPHTTHEDHNQVRDFPVHRPPSKNSVPYESPPHLQAPPYHHHRINSPSFNNYSPIHRLVVTGGNHHHLSRAPSNPSATSYCVSPLIPPHFPNFHPDSSHHPQTRHGERFSTNSSNNDNNNAPPPPPTFTNNINRPGVYPTCSQSPVINHHHHHHHSISSPRPPHISSHTFTSPSPVLRNPKYQYITSSNQNSPVLNVPKRLNVSTRHPNPNHTPHPHYYCHNESQGRPSPKSNPPKGTSSFSTFSPKPPPRTGQSSGSGASAQTNALSNPFLAANPNLNQQKLENVVPKSFNPQVRHGVVDCELEIVSSPSNLQYHHGGSVVGGPPCTNPSSILSRSQSYQAQNNHQVHYYASPVVSHRPLIQQRVLHPHMMHPTSLSFNEPPLLMKAHLHNQNVRLNNFLMNKQRIIPSHLHTPGGQASNVESFQERIYETVDPEDDEVENGNDDVDYDDQGSKIHPCNQNTNGRTDPAERRKSDLANAIPNPEAWFQPKKYTLRAQQNSKSKRSKSKPSSSCVDSMKPRPRVPMTLFGPNTFLSETETRILEADREADRKYKRLINEAEAILKEISAVKSHHPKPWACLSQEKVEDQFCPQSDPLRRKAETITTWTLRRLQQELAGCCASPPVLHRSRMNLQSPSTPTTNIVPYFTVAPQQVPHFKNAVMLESNKQCSSNAHF